MQLAERCLDCPLSRSDAFGLVLVSLSLLLFGRVLLAIPRRLLRGFGLVGLGAALVLHAFGLTTVALLGIAWAHPDRGKDALFAGGWLLLSIAVLLAAARIGRAFPVRAHRLEVIDGEGGRGADSPSGRDSVPPRRGRERRRAP